MTGQRFAIDRINRLSGAGFVRVAGPLFEKSPWIAARAASQRPFRDLAAMARALRDIVRAAPSAKKLALIRAHPDLAGRAALAGKLTRESAREQSGAGLGSLTPRELALFQRRNEAYRKKFQFPFIICAGENTKASILDAFARRLRHSRAREIETALSEIFKIARLRLRDLAAAPAARPRLSSHVLDTARGRPAAGMRIDLWRVGPRGRRRLKSVRANADGRPNQPLLGPAEMRRGQYELVFFVGDYFAVDGPRFLDRVPVRFAIVDASASYHIPLLCSPWAYSTYRGS